MNRPVQRRSKTKKQGFPEKYTQGLEPLPTPSLPFHSFPHDLRVASLFFLPPFPPLSLSLSPSLSLTFPLTLSLSHCPKHNKPPKKDSVGRSAFAVAVVGAHSDALGLSLLAPSLSAGIIDVHGAVAGDVLCRTWAQLAGGLPLTRAALGAAGADLTIPVYTHTHCTWVCVCACA